MKSPRIRTLSLTNNPVVGGQITLFTKKDCPFCVTVRQALEKCAEKVLRENPGGKLSWKVIDCDISENVALCARLTGKFSVPHVFFGQEYIGNHDFTVKVCGREDNSENNLIYKKLQTLARNTVVESQVFPPIPDATILKVTSQVAYCSSQPNETQLLEHAAAFGFKSVVNLAKTEEVPNEAKLVTSAGLQYLHFPLLDKTLLEDIVSVVRETCENPVLVHCETGPKAALVCLRLAGVEKEDGLLAQAKQFFGVDLAPLLSTTGQQPEVKKLKASCA